MSSQSNVRTQVEEMCVSIATNSLLVQGAGGNVSWKDDNVMWIKASGTRLADAADEDIFIPTDLTHIRESLCAGDFDIIPVVVNDSPLKPSIETLLHGLMPQRVVVHLHAVEVLAHLVRSDCKYSLKNKLAKDTSYAVVKYCKPGRDLARNVYQKIRSDKDVNTVFLMNHGLVVGAEGVSEVLQLLDKILERLKTEAHSDINFQCSMDDEITKSRLQDFGYFPTQYPKFHALSLDARLSYLVDEKWSLFPDHVVFLGPSAFIGDCDALGSMLVSQDSQRPAFIFCIGVGTFQHASATGAQIDQLDCFYEVAIRQRDHSKITKLSKEDALDLVNWDAEKYRLSLSKT